MANREIAVRHTLAFVEAQLAAAPGPRILEVGCGDGEVALGLTQAGFDVVAIDSSAECAANAAAKGIDARQASWPEFHESSFDAVLFTRSLHHIHELGRGLDKVVELLSPAGLLIIEDFSYSEHGPSHAKWMVDIARMVQAAGQEFVESSLCELMLASDSDPEVWQQQHDHDLHDWDNMSTEICRRMKVQYSGNAPYLYRYFVEALATEDTDGILKSIFALESGMGDLDDRWLIGRRLVAIKL